MKEIREIALAFRLAHNSGQACALATVVHVEGSSYRKPGARMLVTDTGQLTGAISGGCLEGDALRKALLAISEGRNKLVTYDTTDEDDAKLGVQLGCNGIVHLLFEPVNTNVENHPLALIEKVIAQRRQAILSTLFSLEDKNIQPGTCLFYDGDELFTTASNVSSPVVPSELIKQDIRSAFSESCSQMKTYEDERLIAFHQFIAPPLSLVIGGAGNDVIPFIVIAEMLGWEVTLVDGRSSHATTQRFPLAKRIVIAKPEAFLQHLAIDSETICVLMSHNYNYDLGMLRQLLTTDVRYIGILGAKSKLGRMYADLEKEGIIVADRSRIFSPVGLDIGAETPEEIALSIAAEIKCVLMNRDANMLRFKQRSVHT